MAILPDRAREEIEALSELDRAAAEEVLTILRYQLGEVDLLRAVLRAPKEGFTTWAEAIGADPQQVLREVRRVFSPSPSQDRGMLEA